MATCPYSHLLGAKPSYLAGRAREFAMPRKRQAKKAAKKEQEVRLAGDNHWFVLMDGNKAHGVLTYVQNKVDEVLQGVAKKLKVVQALEEFFTAFYKE